MGGLLDIIASIISHEHFALIAAAIVVASLGIVYLSYRPSDNNSTKSVKEQHQQQQKQQSKQAATTADVKKKQQQLGKKKESEGKLSKKQQKKLKERHPLLANELKGLSKSASAFVLSQDESYLATISEGVKAITLYFYSSLFTAHKKMARLTLENEVPTAIDLSHDSTKLVVATNSENQVSFTASIYDIKKDKHGRLLFEKTSANFPKNMHNKEIRFIQFGQNSKWLMTACAGREDTTIKFWSLQGSLLAEIDTKQLIHNTVTLSKNGEFFTAGTWMSSMKIWKTVAAKKPAATNKTKAGSSASSEVSISSFMELAGHTGGIPAVAFSSDARRVASCVAKDGSFRVYNIDTYNERYHTLEDAKLLVSAKAADVLANNDDAAALFPSFELVALSDTGSIAALVHEGNLLFYSVDKKQVLEMIPNAHSGKISRIQFDSNSKHLLSSGPDLKIKFWTVPQQQQQ